MFVIKGLAMSKAYTVVAILEAKQGKETELKQELIKLLAPSRAEQACLEYRMHQDLNNPAKFFFYENWVNQEGHLQHFQTSHITALIDKLDDLLAKPFETIFAEEI